jgi:hypothetical protein
MRQVGHEDSLGLEVPMRPLAICLRVQEATVETVGTAVPELDQVRVEPVAVPVVRAPQRFVASSQRSGLLPQTLQVLQLLALIGSNGGRLARGRAFRKQPFGLGRAHPLDRAQ